MTDSLPDSAATATPPVSVVASRSEAPTSGGVGANSTPHPASDSTSATAAERFPRWADLTLYAAQMAIGLLLVVFSIPLKHLAATIITGLAGFTVIYAAIRYGWLARRFHDGV